MTHNLKPSPAYKPSGVGWLGEIPEHWELRKLKFIAVQVSEKVEIKSDNINYIGLENIESWTGKLVESELVTEGTASRFRKNDVLFGKLRPYLAKVYLAEDEGFCSTEALVLRTSSQNPRFLFYFLLSRMFIDLVNSSVYGAKMPRASWDFIGSQLLPFPLPGEQQRIAAFLDQKTAEIDEAISKKQRLIELLKEQKAILINQAVTKGPNPNVPMRDSGVEWLGDVPAHWEVAALRHRYSQCLGKMLDSKRITGNHSLPYLRNVDVQWDQINTKDLPTMDIPPDEYERYTVQQGDLLVCEGGEVGRCALWSGDLTTCGFQKALHRLRPRKAGQDVPRFMHYALRAAVKGNAFNDGHLSTIAHLTGDKLRAHRFPFPPVAEQESLVRFLDVVLKQADRAVSRVRRQIELLREYRARLISDVVTGKLDVREEAHRES